MYLFNPKCLVASILILVISNFWGVDAQGAAAWPATSYSPYFQSLFAQASAPVAAIPSGLGAQGPSIPVPGPPGGPLPPMPPPMPIAAGGPGLPVGGPAYGGGTPGAGLLGSGAAYAPAVGPGFGRR